MKDNIGNEIRIRDQVFCFTGKYKNTRQTVIGFRVIEGDFGATYGVNFAG